MSRPEGGREGSLRIGTRVDPVLPVVVVGAGPAGLATARELGRRGIPCRILERGEGVGWVWANLYDSLRLHTGKHLSTLPGLRFPRSTPLFPSRAEFVAYLEDYARTFDLNVETGVEVTNARQVPGGWALETGAGPLRTPALVMATGIVSSPVVPALPGREEFRGRVLHSAEYHRPEPFAGQHVLVVGVGNSGGEIGSELARAGVDVSVAVRSGANVVPLTLAGLPIQYLAVLLRRLPRQARERVVAFVRRRVEARRGPPVLPPSPRSPLDAIPLIGFHLVDEIQAGRVAVRPGVDAFTADGVRFTDGTAGAFDAVILATGFRAALAPLEGVVRRDERGFARRRDRVVSADAERLVFVGQNYDAGGGLRNIRQDAPLAAEAVRRALRM